MVGASRNCRTGHDDWDIVSGVGRTALAAAAARAVESRRRGGLISDPFAEAFVQAAEPQTQMFSALDPTGDDAADSEFQRMITLHLGTRTRLFDEYLTGTCAVVPQVVLLAAGLDARALRLTWPAGTVLFEVDQPRVLEFKRDVLARTGAGARCDRREVPVDLRDDWPAALAAAGFDASRPTAWLAEGLLPYLAADTEAALLDAITALSAPGSRLATECFTRTTGWPSQARDLLENMSGADVFEMFDLDARPAAAERLRTVGWTVRADLTEHIAARWGEPALGELTERFGTPSVALLTASR